MKMESRKPKNHTVIDMYKAWCKQLLLQKSEFYGVWDTKIRKPGIQVIYHDEDDRPVMFMSYTMFRLIIETYNKYAAKAVIEGERLSLGAKLGFLVGVRIERNMNKLRCDMIATRDARKIDNSHPAIFYTEPDIFMIWWIKNHKVRNETVYSFVPAKHSFKRDFYRAIKNNPILRTNFRYYPLIQKATA